MESIKKWLNSSKNYNVGLALYLAHGSDDTIKRALQQGESPYRKELLFKELRAIYERSKTGENNTIVVRPSSQALPSPAVLANPKSNKDDPYYSEWHPLYKEMMDLRSQLTLLPNDRERGEAAFRVLELERKCRAIWKRRDYYQKTGEHMPEATNTPEPVSDYNVLQKRLYTLRTYVTREGKKLKENPNDTKAKSRLDRFTAEAKEIENKLKTR